MALTPGSRLGPYEIVAAIGSGGMGDVYRAYDARLDRFVAIKVLPDTVRDDPERRERFEREARAIAALNHPNIVTIHSVERAGDVSFLTMELVEGKPLTSVIPRAGLPLDRVLSIMIPVVDAIAAAHQRGITHRDLKPANIMVGDGPQHGALRCWISAWPRWRERRSRVTAPRRCRRRWPRARGGFWAPSPTWRLNRRKGSRLTADRICSRSA
jgi:serine/threonine protein kinase